VVLGIVVIFGHYYDLKEYVKKSALWMCNPPQNVTELTSIAMYDPG